MAIFSKKPFLYYCTSPTPCRGASPHCRSVWHALPAAAAALELSELATRAASAQGVLSSPDRSPPAPGLEASHRQADRQTRQDKERGVTDESE